MLTPHNCTHVLYHANCPDGFGAAYASWRALGSQAAYLPVRHGDEPPQLEATARVAMVDFSYPRDILLQLRSHLSGLVVLDHHKSAQEELLGLEFAHFDLNQSGARMAWDYWHPGRPLPDLLAYVEDRDLWRWLLPASREVSLALQCYPMDFEVWQELQVDQLITEGGAILRYQKQQVARAVSRMRMTQLGDYLIPAVNSCLLQSEIGDELCLRYPDSPFSAVYYQSHRNDEAWSLRSIGDFDVAKVAQAFGGGGHRNAAGFARPLQA